MYETSRDIVIGQRKIGIECGMIDAHNQIQQTDGSFSTENVRYADLADVYVMHLAVPEPYLSDGTPVVIALHGNPLYSMQSELYGLEPGNTEPFTTILRYFQRTSPTWFASMWEEEQGSYWDAIDGARERMRYIPRGIHFGDKWTPQGEQKDLDGDPCIVIADQFRLFKDALPVLWGAYHYWMRNPKARIYLFGLPQQGHECRTRLDRWIGESNLHRMIGGTFGVVNYLPDVFRRADVLLSTVTGESRVVLESMACGCKTVAPWPGSTVPVDRFWEPPLVADAIEDALSDRETREERSDMIRSAFPLEATARGWQKLYEEILG